MKKIASSSVCRKHTEEALRNEEGCTTRYLDACETLESRFQDEFRRLRNCKKDTVLVQEEIQRIACNVESEWREIHHLQRKKSRTGPWSAALSGSTTGVAVHPNEKNPTTVVPSPEQVIRLEVPYAELTSLCSGLHCDLVRNFMTRLIRTVQEEWCRRLDILQRRWMRLEQTGWYAVQAVMVRVHMVRKWQVAFEGELRFSHRIAQPIEPLRVPVAYSLQEGLLQATCEADWIRIRDQQQERRTHLQSMLEEMQRAAVQSVAQLAQELYEFRSHSIRHDG